MSNVLNELARFISAPGADAFKTALKTLLDPKGFISVPLAAVTMEDGTALTKQATTVTGFLQISNKETVIDIPVNCTSGEALGLVVPVPLDIDTDYPLEVHVIAGKGGALDALTLDCEVFPIAVGDTANADIQDTAAITLTQAAAELTFSCAASSLLAPPGAVSVVLTLGGTNDGDAVYIYSVWLEYTKVLLVE